MNKQSKFITLEKIDYQPQFWKKIANLWIASRYLPKWNDKIKCDTIRGIKEMF